MKIEQSFTELSARERAFALLDQGSARELLGPFAHLKSPHLLGQGIVAQNDDGMIVVRGSFRGTDAVVIAMEGKFQGGGIGEIAGAKFAAALELVLADNRKGRMVQPIIVMDTGGVRLQEANLGLLAIAEIQDLLVQVRNYVPVIALIPGRVGCFGGMSMTSGLFSYLIMTREGRLTLNGPEVIEQEAGRKEWDSSDKAFTYRTIGGAHRVEQGLADMLVHDSVHEMQEAVSACIAKGIPAHRSTMIEHYRALVDQEAPGPQENSSAQLRTRGRIWFDALTKGGTPVQTTIGSVLAADISICDRPYRVIAVVPDGHTAYPRTIKGEVGLQQGWELARIVRETMKEDCDRQEKRAIVALVDVPSQAYGYREEYNGIFLSCAASVNAYADARHAGHPVVTFIVGNAISGAFLAHGLQGSYMLSLDDETITVHAMSKKSAARITKRSIEDMDDAADKVAAIAYDIHSFYRLGAVNKLLRFADHDHPTVADVDAVKQELAVGAVASRSWENRLHYRLETEDGEDYRRLSIKVRSMMQEEWNA